MINPKIKQQMKLGERALIQAEIDKRFSAQMKQFNLIANTVNAFVLHEVFGFGAERIKRYFRECDKIQKRMNERYEDADLYAMKKVLKDIGIDIEALVDGAMNDENRGKTEF